MSAQYAILKEEIDRFAANKALDQCIGDSQSLLDSLRLMEASLVDGKDVSSPLLAKQVKSWSDKTLKNEKSVNTAIKRYGKAFDRTFNFNYGEVYNYKIPQGQSNRLLIDRAVIMHLLRNGDFDVAEAVGAEDGMTIPRSLMERFEELHAISTTLIKDGDLDKAIAWAKQNSERLEAIGSDLEFNLHKLQFVKLYNGTQDYPFAAYSYAKRNFPTFGATHLETISKLVSSILYAPTDTDSPYRSMTEFQEVSFNSIFHQLSQDYCSLIGLSSESPLYVSLLTSYVALPNFVKYNNILKNSGGRLDWTTKTELPFEINLPSELQFHSIFICPVSREETTLANPPMLLPCKHILSKDSLDRLARSSSSFKCPYCPSTSLASQAQQVNFVSLSEYR
ncbi:unnamed protein product [Kuraishia capsulata CBS 1993]|uniref:GID complex catalytic subunit 2 n=1 Tax=Kuraishia capsulata CBS 1993 TaxID=1382522 RepID=W6MK43_9ASCO|nr:uncharacterized protein KUCA_T00002665001 [Kuraishia capsulata CBS 1993]CDK26691.1 unnamed protein product [Kuraishia capsulata CBS 1993]